MNLRRMRELSPTIDFMEEHWHELVAVVDEARRGKFTQALQRFGEGVHRLTFRHQEFISIATEIYRSNPSSGITANTPFAWQQLRLVDKIEAFHQQIYAVLSLLVLVMNRATSTEGQPRYSISSVKRFLEQLEEEFRYNSKVLDAINILKRSVEFRGKF